MKWKSVVDLDDSTWLCDVAVTVDVSALSLKMNSSKAKWKRWRVHLERKNTETFPPRTKACHDASFHGGVCKTPSSILQNVTGHEIKTKATEHVCYVGSCESADNRRTRTWKTGCEEQQHDYPTSEKHLQPTLRGQCDICVPLFEPRFHWAVQFRLAQHGTHFLHSTVRGVTHYCNSSTDNKCHTHFCLSLSSTRIVLEQLWHHRLTYDDGSVALVGVVGAATPSFIRLEAHR